MTMDRKSLTNREQGQITIIMVFATIALFGAAALAIDGGFLYFQRRAAQSVADDIAMTGALAITKGYSGAQRCRLTNPLATSGTKSLCWEPKLHSGYPHE
jgi:uncharacterized membrane protein